MHIRALLLTPKPKLMGMSMLKYINYYFSLYFLNMQYKPHKCTHNITKYKLFI